MNVDAVFVVIDCCYRLYDRFVVKLHACLPEKIDSYLILSYLIHSTSGAAYKNNKPDFNGGSFVDTGISWE